MEKIKFYKRLIFVFFSRFFLGPVSAPLSKLDLAIFVIKVRTVFGVDGGWKSLLGQEAPLRAQLMCTLSPHSSSWLHSPVLILGLVLVTITLYFVCFIWRGESTKGWEQHRSSPSAGQTSAKACAQCYCTWKVCKSQVAIRTFPLQLEKHLLHVK